MALKEQSSALRRALHDPAVSVRMGAAQGLETIAISRNLLLDRAARAGGKLRVPTAAADSDLPSERQVRQVVFRVRLPDSDDPLLACLSATLPALVVSMYDPDPRVRLKAIEVLEVLGAPALPAAPVLIRSLGDPDCFVRWAAVRTLGKLGPVEPEGAVPALHQLLSDPDMDVRRSAVATLVGYRDAAKPALPGLIAALRAPDPVLRATALRVLAGLGTDAEPAVPSLRAALDDPDTRVRQLASELLCKLEAIRQR
jgi:HEAT repeat protein